MLACCLVEVVDGNLVQWATTSSTRMAPSRAVAVKSRAPEEDLSLQVRCSDRHTMPDPHARAQSLWRSYVDGTPARMQLCDAFLVFLMATGVFLFLYCVVVTNYPFNAFLAACVRRLSTARCSQQGIHSFASTVGQFVLVASLRMQANPANKTEFGGTSPERYGRVRCGSGAR
jgi:oligosaccharyltransferase complex subunit epsilon